MVQVVATEAPLETQASSDQEKQPAHSSLIDKLASFVGAMMEHECLQHRSSAETHHDPESDECCLSTAALGSEGSSSYAIGEYGCELIVSSSISSPFLKN